MERGTKNNMTGLLHGIRRRIVPGGCCADDQRYAVAADERYLRGARSLGESNNDQPTLTCHKSGTDSRAIVIGAFIARA